MVTVTDDRYESIVYRRKVEGLSSLSKTVNYLLDERDSYWRQLNVLENDLGDERLAARVLADFLVSASRHAHDWTEVHYLLGIDSECGMRAVVRFDVARALDSESELVKDDYRGWCERKGVAPLV